MPTGSPRAGRNGVLVVVGLLLTAMWLTGCGRGSGQISATAPPSPDPGLHEGMVRTTSGVVRGEVAPEYQLFQGIPYAAPPVGALRWQPPQPAAPWTGVRDASKPGPRCIQDVAQDPGTGWPDSEDCLSLNVWSPKGAAGRPVMVWLHGGGFANGSGILYDSRWLTVKGDIVVVTVNYRLGALGFLAHPDLDDAAGGSGNFGFADQQAALRWVRDNIAGFGGDPAKVTVAGESAGAMSVCDHLVAPGSAGLFRSAILQSGPCGAQADLATAYKAGLNYARDHGCPDPKVAAACLRALPSSALLKPVWNVRVGDDALSGPATGTPALPKVPVDPAVVAEMPRVPVLIGTNRDEYTLFSALRYLRIGRLLSAGEYSTELRKVFGADADAVQARYPLGKYDGKVELAYSAAVTDDEFACVAHELATNLASRHDAAPVYAYEFDDQHAPAPEPMRKVPFPVGASHSLEVRYLFDVGGAPPLNTAQQQLSGQMIDYWTNFITTGSPDGLGLTEWPRFAPSGGQDGAMMSLRSDGNRVITDFAQAHNCGFWSELRK